MRLFLWPTWAQRKRIIRLQAWVFVVAVYALLVPAWLLPQDFSVAREGYVAVRWFFFMGEMFRDPFGLLLLAIAAGAAHGRCWRLLLAAAPMLLVTAGPVLWRYVPSPAPPVEGPRFTVLSANLFFLNPRKDELIEEMLNADADVIALQEYTSEWHAAIEGRLGEAYPHRFADPQEDAFGAAIYSRLPFREEPALMYGLGPGELPQIRAVLDVGGRAVAVYNIHLLPPMRLEYVIARHGQFDGLLKQLAGEKLPLVLVGDFNFTATNAFARALSAAGMTDAFAEAGYGLGATWPVNGILRYLPVPGIQIDHLYLKGGLACASIRTGHGAGSDHRPLVARVGWRGEKR